jgi:hypothetical protein
MKIDIPKTVSPAMKKLLRKMGDSGSSEAYYIGSALAEIAENGDGMESDEHMEQCARDLIDWAQEVVDTLVYGPATAELMKLAEERKLKAEDLDEVVHDLADVDASTTNNGGLEEQIAYFIKTSGIEGARDLINGIEPE